LFQHSVCPSYGNDEEYEISKFKYFRTAQILSVAYSTVSGIMPSTQETELVGYSFTFGYFMTMYQLLSIGLGL
jgi:hypothetical protein